MGLRHVTIAKGFQMFFSCLENCYLEKNESWQKPACCVLKSDCPLHLKSVRCLQSEYPASWGIVHFAWRTTSVLNSETQEKMLCKLIYHQTFDGKCYFIKMLSVFSLFVCFVRALRKNRWNNRYQTLYAQAVCSATTQPWSNYCLCIISTCIST